MTPTRLTKKEIISDYLVERIRIKTLLKKWGPQIIKKLRRKFTKSDIASKTGVAAWRLTSIENNVIHISPEEFIWLNELLEKETKVSEYPD